MNKFIARIFSQALEFIHALFLLGIIIFTIYSFSDAGRLSIWQVMLVYLTAFGTWVVVFGFITTIVVMADTLTEIKEQNRTMVAFLQKIAAVTTNVTPQAQTPVPTTRRSNEPFIGSDAVRR